MFYESIYLSILKYNLDLNEHLIKHPAATFYVYAKGDSMINSGIHDGDLLIVDRSLNPGLKSIVIAVINGEFTVNIALIESSFIQNYVYFQKRPK